MGAERTPCVLLTADTVGGVWTYAVELSRALAGRGVRIHLATMGAPLQPAQRRQLDAIAGLRLHESHWRLEWMEDPWDDVAAAGRWLLKLARTLQPDLVHLNQFAFGALPFEAPTLLVAHSCVLSWWRAVHAEAAPPSWDRYREQVRRGLEGAGLVAAPTRAMLESLVLEHGHAGAGRVLPNGVDPVRFAPAVKAESVLAAGRFWDAAKNLSALQAVAPQLAWPVRIAGACTAPGGASLTTGGVQALGELAAPTLAREMARASIYALPARYEPFGLSILEAALSGCALVIGDIASLHEIWGDAAVYVAPDDHAALARALQRLIDDAGERSRLAQAARARALDFSARRMADACLDAYAQLNPRFERSRLEETSCA